MDRVKLSIILGHQLKGIMLHSDLCRAYLVRKNKRCAFTQYVRTLAETKTFLLTNEKIIDKLGCLVEPIKEARILVPDNATDEQLKAIWRDWEQDTLAMYEEASLMDQDCKWWKKLLKEVKKELTTL